MGFSRQDYWSGMPLPSLLFLIVLIKTSLMYCRMSLYWKFSYFFSHDYTEVMAFGEKYHRGKLPFSSQNIKSAFYQHDIWLMKLTLITWLSKVSLLNCHLPPQFHTVIFVRNSFCPVLVLSHSVMPNSLRPVDCNPPGSSVLGILQERILEWVAIPLSRGSFPPKDRTQVSYITGRFFTIWATRETPDLSQRFHKMHFMENPKNRGAWWITVLGVAKNWTWLSD